MRCRRFSFNYFTVTVTSPFAVPLPPVHVILYVVVIVGRTDTGAAELGLPVPSGLLLLLGSKSVHWVGPTADQVRDAVLPEVMVVGFATMPTLETGGVVGVAGGVAGVVGVEGAVAADGVVLCVPKSLPRNAPITLPIELPRLLNPPP